jgi:hypothetical protein
MGAGDCSSMLMACNGSIWGFTLDGTQVEGELIKKTDGLLIG